MRDEAALQLLPALPAEPLELWTTPPFAPTLRDGALYARGAKDDKGEFVARLAAVAEEQMAALHPELGDVPVERVVRFGRLSTELRIEAQAFGADLIGLAAPGRPRLAHQLRAWYLGRTLPVPVVLLPSAADGADEGRPETVVLPAFR